jgi:hypothetical protein
MQSANILMPLYRNHQRSNDWLLQCQDKKSGRQRLSHKTAWHPQQQPEWLPLDNLHLHTQMLHHMPGHTSPRKILPQRKETHWANFYLFLPSFLHFFYCLPVTGTPNQCLGLGQFFWHRLFLPKTRTSHFYFFLFFVNSDSAWFSMCFFVFCHWLKHLPAGFSAMSHAANPCWRANAKLVNLVLVHFNNDTVHG